MKFPKTILEAVKMCPAEVRHSDMILIVTLINGAFEVWKNHDLICITKSERRAVRALIEGRVRE